MSSLRKKREGIWGWGSRGGGGRGGEGLKRPKDCLLLIFYYSPVECLPVIHVHLTQDFFKDLIPYSPLLGTSAQELKYFPQLSSGDEFIATIDWRNSDE